MGGEVTVRAWYTTTKGPTLRIESADRKRLLVATAATMLALPLLVRENRAQQGERPDAVAAVAPGVDLAGPLRAASPSTDAPNDSTSERPAAPPEPPPTTSEAPVVTAAPIDIATPVSTSGSAAAGRATYRHLATTPGAHWCATGAAPRNKTLHVLDLDNGHEITCTNISTRAPNDGDVVALDTELFKLLADLSQAPIPVTVSW